MKCQHCKMQIEDDGGSKAKCPECKALIRWSFDMGGKVYFIPQHMIEGINRYIFDKYPTGDFLTAIFENDFVQAMGRADIHNFANIQAYGDLLYNFVPLAAWGDKKKVKDWLKSGYTKYTCQCGQANEIHETQSLEAVRCSACKVIGKFEKDNDK